MTQSSQVLRRVDKGRGYDIVDDGLHIEDQAMQMIECEVSELWLIDVDLRGTNARGHGR